MNKYNGRSSHYVNNLRKDLEHGMAIEQVLQNYLLNIKTDDDKYLVGGASGSMAIDSRFNIIGVLYNALFANPNNIDLENPDTNSIALFKHHSKLEQWHGSIYQDVLNKMKKRKN